MWLSRHISTNICCKPWLSPIFIHHHQLVYFQLKGFLASQSMLLQHLFSCLTPLIDNSKIMKLILSMDIDLYTFSSSPLPSSELSPILKSSRRMSSTASIFYLSSSRFFSSFSSFAFSSFIWVNTVKSEHFNSKHHFE